jgi:anaerobic selenocysteine-containing dehydrogenase
MSARKTATKSARPARGGGPAAETRVRVKRAAEAWSEITLGDGSIVRLRPAIINVVRLPGKFTNDGTPVYRVKSAMIMHVNAPSRLRRPKR